MWKKTLLLTTVILLAATITQATEMNLTKFNKNLFTFDDAQNANLWHKSLLPSLNKYNLSYTNTGIVSGSGLIGQSFYFNADTDWCKAYPKHQIWNVTLSKNWSVNTWVNRAASSGGFVFANIQGTYRGWQWYFAAANGKTTVDFYGTGSGTQCSATTNTAIPSGAWTMLTVTYATNAGTATLAGLKIYVDAVDTAVTLAGAGCGTSWNGGNASFGNPIYAPFAGTFYMDIASEFTKTLNTSEISFLKNRGYGRQNLTNITGGAAPPATPTVNWQGYPPANNTRNNSASIKFWYNISNAGMESCQVCNGTGANCWGQTTPVLKDTKYQVNATSLGNNKYKFFMMCLNTTKWYNSSFKTYEVDVVQPTITCNYPSCANTTVHTNGTSMKFNFSFFDKNLDGYNITVRKPDGTTFFSNYTDNLTAQRYNFTRTMTLINHGWYTGLITDWDDHNPLTDKKQVERVSKYTKEKTAKGEKLKAYKNDITHETDDKDISIQYTYVSDHWAQTFTFNKKVLAGTTTVVDIYATQPIRQKLTIHQAHLITGMQSVDFDGLPATARAEQLSLLHWQVRLVWQRDIEKGEVLQASSVNELNIRTLSFKFKSNAAPIITSVIADRYSDTSVAWSFQANATDANGDSLTWTQNDSHVSIVAGTGMVSDLPVQADNGTYAVLLTVSDGTLTDTDVFMYTINISNSGPNITNKITKISTTGTPWTYQFNATDLDGDTLTWAINTTMISLDTATGLISDTPTWLDNGQHWIRLNVTDGKGGRDNNTFQYNVTVPHTAVNTSTLMQLVHCSMYGNWTNGTECGHQALTEENTMQIAIAIIVTAVLALFLIVTRFLSSENYWMQQLKLLLVLTSFHISWVMLGIAYAFANDSGASQAVKDLLFTIYTVVFWAVWVITAIIVFYLIFKALNYVVSPKELETDEGDVLE